MSQMVEISPIEQEEKEKVQEQNKQIEHAQEEYKVNKMKQKKRITSYLSNVSKQVEKQGNQINKITLMIQSLQETKPTVNARIDRSQSEFIKQIKYQINHLHRQIAQIENDVLRIRTVSITGKRQGSRTKVRK
jgi:hypothetical protein